MGPRGMPGTRSSPRVVPGTGAMVGSPLPLVPPRRFMALISELLPAVRSACTVWRAGTGVHSMRGGERRGFLVGCEWPKSGCAARAACAAHVIHVMDEPWAAAHTRCMRSAGEMLHTATRDVFQRA